LTGVVLAGSTFISIATVDRLGRRPLLISGGIQMIICQVWKNHGLMQIPIIMLFVT